MSMDLKKADLIAYYAEMNAHPPSKMVEDGTWKPMVVPQWVLDSDENDMFSWGLTLFKDGRFASAPLHRSGRIVNGRFEMIQYEGPGRAELTLIPREE